MRHRDLLRFEGSCSVVLGLALETALWVVAAAARRVAAAEAERATTFVVARRRGLGTPELAAVAADSGRSQTLAADPATSSAPRPRCAARRTSRTGTPVVACAAGMTITHHELCFGCGIANLFGLQMEVEPAEAGDGVSGRFFLKQDHQGPPGYAHGGVIACALDEAMALCVQNEGETTMTGRLEVDFRAPAPVGTFVRVAARVERREGRTLDLTASARGVGGERPLIAEARARFVAVGEARSR